ncbi:MAG: maleylpyruvate isomerase family mycothiol-dependent enzyme [Acidimicrobiia bacterium]
MADDATSELVEDLAAEQDALVELLESIDTDDWFRPTPAWSWDVRDTVAHLADTDELAVDTCIDGPRSLGALAAGCASSEDLTLLGVLRGRALAGADVLAWWMRAQMVEREVLLSLDPQMRVPWGLGMRPPSFVTARMMETWAHSLDVHSALGREPVDTDRLRHVAWIGVRALPYAFSVVGVAPPEGPLRVELVLPSGTTWTFGALDAPDRITGPASEFCRVFVQRMPAEDATNLVAEGEGAQLALRVARSFL